MSIFQIAVNNLKRKKVKAIFLLLGLVVGVSTVIGFTNIIQAMNLDLGNKIDEFGANSIILPRSEDAVMNYDDKMDSEVVYAVQKLTMSDIPKILESSVSEYINIISPKLVGAVQINDKKTLIIGIQTKQEFMQKPWFSLKAQDSLALGAKPQELAFIDMPDDGLIIGSSAARALNAEVGEQLILNGSSFKVFGVLNEVGSEEDGLIYADLGAVQTLLDKDSEVSMIEVSAYCNSCPIEEIAVGIEEALPNSRVTPIRKAALFREETIGQFSKFGMALSGMVLLISVLIVFKTMLSSVNERTREIGIFRAIGFRRFSIIKIIFIEAGIVSVIGGIMGFILGSFAAIYAGPYLANIQGDIPIQIELLLPAILISTGIALVASAYPALKAAQLDPAEALRFV